MASITMGIQRSAEQPDLNPYQERAMCTFTHLVQRFDGTGAVRTFDGIPDHCPACGRAIEPRRLAAHSTSRDDLLVDFAFQCPHVLCRRMFVAEYGFAADDTFTLLEVCAPAHQEEYLRF